MPTLYLTEDRALVRRDSEECLLVQIPEQKDKEGVVLTAATKKRLPLIKIEEVVVLGEVTFTASALHLLLDKNVVIHFLSQYGHLKGSLSPNVSKNALLRLAQHRGHIDIKLRSELARSFVLGKLSNQRTLLRRYARRFPGSLLTQGIERMSQSIECLTNMNLIEVEESAPTLKNGDMGIRETSLETILGWEGSGSAAYFGCFDSLLSKKDSWTFPGRVKRPPTDPVNALLSYGYALLTSQVASLVQLVGLDPYIGYLHSSTYGRTALALDLMEEFRPIIVDSVVLTLLNNRMLTLDDFHVELGTYRLKKEPRKLFLTKFEERLNEEIIHPFFGYKAKYRRCIELQARLLAKFLTGEIDHYPSFLVR